MFTRWEDFQVGDLLVNSGFHIFYVDGFYEHQSSCVCFSVDYCSVFFKFLSSQFPFVPSLVVFFDGSILQVAGKAS